MDEIDLFEREQLIYDSAIARYNEMKSGVTYSAEDYGKIAKEYGKLLKQLRRVTRMYDKTTEGLNASKLDLLDKVHYDVLTGIYNRRFFEESMTRLISSISRSGGIMSVLMADIDYFKNYNDTYGHSKGDDCLKIVAGAIKDSITRAEDFVARYGGEEFVIVLPDTEESGACVIAKRILENVRACNIPHESSDAANRVTISIGVTTGAVRHNQCSADFICRADSALYASKQNGRNRYSSINFETGLIEISSAPTSSSIGGYV